MLKSQKKIFAVVAIDTLVEARNNGKNCRNADYVAKC
jgi:hypothetical protein